MRFIASLQYRAAALGGLATQFAWGFMYLLLFQAFYRSDPSAIPMPMEQLVSYIWLQQAFLVLFTTYSYDNTIIESITGGGIAYEIVRPTSLFTMWFVKHLAARTAGASLRCFPIIIFAAFLPAPYRLLPPVSLPVFLLFLFSLMLGAICAAALTMFQYSTLFYTMSPMGIRAIFIAVVELFSGSIIPLTFFPDGIRQVMELLPFAALQNTPLRIYAGNISGREAAVAVLLQIFWCVVIIGGSYLLVERAKRKIVVQGG